MKFSKFTQLEKEEVIKHLIFEQESIVSPNNLWSVLWKGIKYIVISIFLYLITEGPASYLFDKIVRWLESR